MNQEQVPMSLKSKLYGVTQELKFLAGRKPAANENRPTPGQLFDTVLPRLLAESSSRLSGRMALTITGPSGRSWTIDFAERTVSPGVASADLTLAMAPHDFIHLMRNQLDAARAFSAGRIKFEGDLDLLTTLAQVMSPNEV
jgi:hypothetical protein